MGDLSLFRLLPELEYLDLSKNQITEIDKACFYDGNEKGDYNQLKTLDLSGNKKLTKIPTLYLLKNLEKMIISDTMVSDLSFLTANLERLSYLDASHCKITSFEMLDGLKLLKTLTNVLFYGNPVEIILEYRCKLVAYCTWHK